jgi:hypothetical protein
MRRAARVDANQAEIVKALRKIGATVQPLHAVGKGCPDLLVGWRQGNYLFEVKDGAKPPSARALTPDEQDWIAGWRGPVVVVTSAMEAIGFLQGVRP